LNWSANESKTLSLSDQSLQVREGRRVDWTPLERMCGVERIQKQAVSGMRCVIEKKKSINQI